MCPREDSGSMVGGGTRAGRLPSLVVPSLVVRSAMQVLFSQGENTGRNLLQSGTFGVHYGSAYYGCTT